MNERHTLDSDAQEMVDLLAERMPLPFHLMGVQGTGISSRHSLSLTR